MKPRVLITGSTGLLGLHFLLNHLDDFDIIAVKHRREVSVPVTGQVELNYSDIGALEKTLSACAPSLIIHCAGMANVDQCEVEPEKAMFVNAQVPGNLAKICSELGIKLVHISTDHLFDGTVPLLTESANVCPINEYGRTKAFGEEAVQKYCPNALIVRCNFFGWGPSYRPSFSDFVVNNLSKGEPIYLADDIFYSPAIIQNLIWGILELLKREALGIFHLVGNERISKFAFGLKLAELFSYDTRNVNQVSHKSLSDRTVRPVDMSLSASKFDSFVGSGLGSPSENISKLKDIRATSFFEKVTVL